MTATQTWWVYIVLTARDTLYTGIATDVARRFVEHCDLHRGATGAKGAKYFRTVAPVQVVFQKQCLNRSEASQLEARIKKMPRSQKQGLVAGRIQLTR